MSSLRRYIASVFLLRWPKLRRKVLVLKQSSGYIKAIFGSVMCFDINTIFVNWPSFIHHTLLRLLTLWQPDADVSSLLSVFIIYRNSLSLQNTVPCSNSSNSAFLKSTVSWVCTVSQSYSYNTVKISKISKLSESTLQMCITSLNEHYNASVLKQTDLHLKASLSLMPISPSFSTSFSKCEALASKS